MSVFKDEINIIEKWKYQKKLISNLQYLMIFTLWIFGYMLIRKVEGTSGASEANIYYVFGLVFSVVSLATAFVIPNDRDKTISFYKFGFSGYILYTILFGILVFVANLEGSTGTTYTVINTICAYARVLIPLGLIIWQAKKWTFLTGIRQSKQEAINSIKDHGNSGMM